MHAHGCTVLFLGTWLTSFHSAWLLKRQLMLCGFLFLTPAFGAGKNKKGNEQTATVGGKDCSRRKNLVTEIERHGVCDQDRTSTSKSGRNQSLRKSFRVLDSMANSPVTLSGIMLH